MKNTAKDQTRAGTVVAQGGNRYAMRVSVILVHTTRFFEKRLKVARQHSTMFGYY